MCPFEAIHMGEEGPLIDFEKCSVCGDCIASCPSKSLILCGETIPLEELLDEAVRDKDFFWASGGGITVSGGEPLLHSDFVKRLFQELHAMGIHTAVETCGAVPWGSIERIIENTDLFLFDIKHLDPEKHREGTGSVNGVILKNLSKLAETHKDQIIIRFPLIPGFNDDPIHIDRIFAIAQDIGIGEIHILPYHRLGKAKYVSVGKRYQLEDLSPPNSELVKGVGARLPAECGITIKING